jgi:hypothetical protein
MAMSGFAIYPPYFERYFSVPSIAEKASHGIIGMSLSEVSVRRKARQSRGQASPNRDSRCLFPHSLTSIIFKQNTALHLDSNNLRRLTASACHLGARSKVWCFSSSARPQQRLCTT